MPSFLGGKSRSAFGQPPFVLAGNRITIVAFEKEVSLKSLAKRFLDKWKEKVQKNTGGRRKVQVTKAAFKGLHLSVCCLHNGELALF